MCLFGKVKHDLIGVYTRVCLMNNENWLASEKAPFVIMNIHKPYISRSDWRNTPIHTCCVDARKRVKDAADSCIRDSGIIIHSRFYISVWIFYFYI